MKDDICFSDKAAISREILAYLTDHPDAEDTADGIVQWWLLERKIRHQGRLIRDAISELVDKGLLIESGGSGSAMRYKLNTGKQKAEA
ncbi:MAG TPA: hypothetical protein VN260_05625 [Dissulfurispiraceae bacterium]|nr:hypothetical protein [Dissulfurispiraceae bacterium]